MAAVTLACAALAAGLAARVGLGEVRAAEVRGAEAPSSRPNILFLYTDDQAAWALGAARASSARTPTLDRLAAEGATLVNSFTVTPVCSPSRAGLFTSRYGTEVGITDWIHPGQEPELGLDPSLPTWPKLLRAAGYNTGLVGKWHLGQPAAFHPRRNGFDYFAGFLTGGNSPRDPTFEVDGKTQKLSGFTADVTTDLALKFLHQPREQPFLLCVHYREPHAAYLPVADEDWRPFADLDPLIPNPDFPQLDTAKVRRMTREYLASVHSIDRNVARLLKALDERGLAANTLVAFTSDHGYNIGHHGVWHKGNGHWILTEPPPGTKNVPKNQRPNMFDTSLRVPTLVRWPGRVKPGTVVTQTVTNLDWLPTLLEAAGVAPPADLKIHGRGFAPLVEGKTVSWNNDFYAQYSTHHQSRTDMRALRTPAWKLVRDFLNPERDELYCLRDDPDETTNLIGSNNPEARRVLGELQAGLLQRMREINDPALPTP